MCAYYPPSFQDRVLQGQRRGEVSAHRHKKRHTVLGAVQSSQGMMQHCPSQRWGKEPVYPGGQVGSGRGRPSWLVTQTWSPTPQRVTLHILLTEAWGWRLGEPGECLGRSRCLISCSFSHQVRPAWIPPLGDGRLHPEEQSGSSRREVDCEQRPPTLAGCYLGKLLTNSGL